MKSLYTSLLLIVLVVKSLTSFAQSNDTVEVQRNKKGTISYLRFKPNGNRSISNSANILSAILKTKTGDEFRLSKELTDNLGITHRRYQQYYKGVKVENAEYLVHGKNGVVDNLNGDFKKFNALSATPAIGEKQALVKALNYIHAKQYKWENETLEQLLKSQTKNPNATYLPKGEVVIVEQSSSPAANYRLSWKFEISSSIPDNAQLIYIDAISGEIIKNVSLVSDANTPITAQTLYSGTVTITGDSFGSGYRLRENRNSVDIITLNAQHSTDISSAIDFTNTSTSFSNGNWTGFSSNQAALDVHYAAEAVLDYWQTVHSRNSVDGNGLRLLNYVNFGTNYGNAAWIGGTNNHYMRYGDGGPFTPFTSLDVTAHEMGHGITEFTSGLAPGTAESAALNEGFSDIYGTCVEYWAAPTKQIWLFGEDVVNHSIATCIRDSQNPKSTSAFEGQHPDTYHGTFWNNGGEPHCNSTVLSHWFYLLSVGSSGVTNDFGNYISVNGLGISVAQIIAFRAESLYLHSSSDYSAARAATIQAARDLYGTNSCQEIAVTCAWYAVGVGDAPYGLNIVNSTNNNCSTNTLTLNNVPSGMTPTWSVTQYYTVNSTSGNSVTLTGNGNATLIASLSAGCGTIAFGKPVNLEQSGPADIYGFVDGTTRCGNNTYNAFVDNSYSYYDWTVSGGTIISGQGTAEIHYTTDPYNSLYTVYNTFYITCHVKDQCGNWIPTSPIEYGTIIDCGPGGGSTEFATFYPNPANNNVTISSNSAANNDNAAYATNQKTPFSYKILNSTGKILKQGASAGDNVIVDTNDILPGSYFLHIQARNKVMRKQIVITH